MDYLAFKTKPVNSLLGLDSKAVKLRGSARCGRARLACRKALGQRRLRGRTDGRAPTGEIHGAAGESALTHAGRYVPAEAARRPAVAVDRAPGFREDPPPRRGAGVPSPGARGPRGRTRARTHGLLAPAR